MSVTASPPVLKENFILPLQQLQILTMDAFKTVESLSYCPEDLLKIITQYATASMLWYTVLEKLDLLSKEIPRLPRHTYQVLTSKCLFPKKEGRELKPDGSAWKTGETHHLYVLPAGTLDELGTCVKEYVKRARDSQGGAHHPEENLDIFWSTGQEKHGNVRFEAEWILTPNDVWEESRNKTWSEQIQLIQGLKARTLTEYRVPSLKQAVAYRFFHRIVTGKRSLYRASTRVQETIEGHHFIVSSDTANMDILFYRDHSRNRSVVVEPLRKL